MTESTKAIASLKKAANYAKLAMRKDGPRSFKRGQGALIKVICKFGDGKLGKDEAKKVLGWRGCDVRAVAKKAADNGYLTISDPKRGFNMELTEMGAEVVKKRFAAEDKAADRLFEGISDAEKQQLIALCEKIEANAEAMGADYSVLQKRHGRHCGERCCGKHGGERSGKSACCEAHGHHGPKYVFVIEGGHGHHHEAAACPERGQGKKRKDKR